MHRIFIFGLGYTAARAALALERAGWEVVSTGRSGTLRFDDSGSVRMALADSSHVLSSVPPEGTGCDPVLDAYGDALNGKSLIYLSSTGVYGDTGGAWVDETAPTGTGRRTARAEADREWLARGAQVLRLPGIYGPGRSALERVESGAAHRIDLADQIFSRVHVDDIVSGCLKALDAPAGAYNLADDLPCSQNAVVDEACRLLRREPPPLQAMDDASLSPMARAFYDENRRVANRRAKRVLGWRPIYPTYRDGLAALFAARQRDQ
ncbi:MULTISPECIES: SDR family NAD(P)-dependent oxidoreductase [unclassified Novosphingobium]|uniref:SDR family NAD(P)-dependent oxidoreductase n=1 Tax=unclassified Novosphingobium TaxID=2644732 RepID=UPI000EDF0FCE|nr:MULTISPECIES: SDR family NAD(P)-dependent oxidoreductase [unclassified Novosphingobium]HCF24228.1 NAD(P)-dependent oxidoreductase [Novosphingobium sp.]HQV02527.1 SDR family NAD(P)-dependent oxidoreductase [Novosphingobium sp.]